MSNLTVDQFNDPSFKVLAERIREAPEFEPLIKTATLSPEEHAALPNTAFAWEDSRLFPLHTPEQAALSYLYATSKTASVPSFVLDALTNALDLYGVKVPDSRVKTASPAVEENLDDYLLPERRRWKVTNLETVKLAEEALHAHKNDLSTEERSYAASKLVLKAQHYGVKLAADTYRVGGFVVSDLETVRHWVEARADHAPADIAPAYAKIANELAKAGPYSDDRDTLMKLATAIGELDKKAGFDTDPHSRFYDPLDTVFNTNKLAEESITVGNLSVPLSKLASLPETMYSDVFGADVVPEIKSGAYLDAEKIANVIPTMPADLLSVFARQIRPYV